MFITTPYYQSTPLSQSTGKDIFLKLENTQPSGSFKLRGISKVCQHAKHSGKRKLVSSSGGNAGIAVAYCGQKLDMPVEVYVPLTTTPEAINNLQSLGAKVFIQGESWAETNVVALENCDAQSVYVHPFDNEQLWQGHATLIDEIVASNHAKPDAIITAVGGGGLLSGIVKGLEKNNWSDVTIFAVETEGAASLGKSYQCNEHLELQKIDTIATSLGAKKVCRFAFEARTFMDIKPIQVTDEDAVIACQKFLEQHYMLVEPACGAALSLLYHKKFQANLERYNTIAVVVCGGTTFSLQRLMATMNA